MVPRGHPRGGSPDQLWAPRPPVGHPLGGAGVGPGRNQQERSQRWADLHSELPAAGRPASATLADGGRPRFLLGPRRKFLVRGGASHIRKRDHARVRGSGRGLGRHQGPESKTGPGGRVPGLRFTLRAV